jgi:hypothetical protein
MQGSLLETSTALKYNSLDRQKDKAVPLQDWTDILGLQEFEKKKGKVTPKQAYVSLRGPGG